MMASGARCCSTAGAGAGLAGLTQPGTANAAWLTHTHGDHSGGLRALAARHWGWQHLPPSLIGRVRPPTPLLIGEQDKRTPPSEAEQYYAAR